MVGRYNAIMIIPYQLERLLWYGLLVCLDSFLVSSPHCNSAYELVGAPPSAT